MNYQKIYSSIIQSAEGRTKQPFLEKHHIIPHSCGGSNDYSNLVYLTTREHFICHLLLVKIYASNSNFRKKMIYALWWMSKSRNGENGMRITSHSYNNARTQFIKENPNKCEIRKQQFIENHKAGKYRYDYTQVSTTLKNTLKLLTPAEMSERMKKSALSGDQTKRADAIRKGKGTKYELTISNTNETVEFWSYDNVQEITGYTRAQLRYRINQCNGMLLNGNIIKYLLKYKGNDGNIGRKRNNGI
jgi:hypothetical protein